MHLKHKNPNILTTIIVNKICYRDSKIIKLKLTLVSPSGVIIEYRRNYTVSPDWFQNFIRIDCEKVERHLIDISENV